MIPKCILKVKGKGHGLYSCSRLTLLTRLYPWQALYIPAPSSLYGSIKPLPLYVLVKQPWFQLCPIARYPFHCRVDGLPMSHGLYWWPLGCQSCVLPAELSEYYLRNILPILLKCHLQTQRCLIMSVSTFLRNHGLCFITSQLDYGNSFL